MRIRPAITIAAVGAFLAGASVFAQIEGGERGVAPIDSSSSLEVAGIAVDVRARTGEAARLGGWRLAQRRGWQQLWAKTHGGAGGESAPGLNDSALDAIVSGIIVENEQIGPNRYVARLGVLFDRGRASAILGVNGQMTRSAPMLVVPVQWSGGLPQSFEARTDWQRAWARFRLGQSPVDYVRPSGTGADPLLLNVGQTERPGRIWWRALLDQYGASDIVSPQVRLVRSYPGGPVIGHFVARRGADGQILGGFTLRVESSEGLAAMLDEGVRRIDTIYATALASGNLQPDPTLVDPPPIIIDVPASDTGVASDAAADGKRDSSEADALVEPPKPATATITVQVQFDSPDASAVGGVEGAVRGASGVQSASTTSLAIGGTSVMRVVYAGDLAGLQAALGARGLRVEESGGGLRVSRP